MIKMGLVSRAVFAVAVSIFLIELVIGIFSVYSRKNELIHAKQKDFHLLTISIEDEIIEFFHIDKKRLSNRLESLAKKLDILQITVRNKETSEELLYTKQGYSNVSLQNTGVSSFQLFENEGSSYIRYIFTMQEKYTIEFDYSFDILYKSIY